MWLLLTGAPVWASNSKNDLHLRVIPCALAAGAVVQGVVGMIYVSLRSGYNQSCFLLVTLYMYAKMVSVFIILSIAAASTWLFPSTQALLALGTVLLQAIEMASAFAVSVRYLQGVEDQEMPKANEICSSVLRVPCVDSRVRQNHSSGSGELDHNP